MGLALNALDPQQIESLDVEQLLDAVLDSSQTDRVCLTCSFQAEDIIVLDFLRKRLPQIPVLFLVLGYQFAETYQLRDRIAGESNLNLLNVVTDRTVAEHDA